MSDLYSELRPPAFAIAYNMLGSVSEAEDVVQEAFLRMYKTLQRDEQINSPRAYIATLVTRLAIDQLRSARARRERYVGEWLARTVHIGADDGGGKVPALARAGCGAPRWPEPLATESTRGRSTADSAWHGPCRSGCLESLTPHQRAAFLLREVFDSLSLAFLVLLSVCGGRRDHVVAGPRDQVQLFQRR